MKTKKMLALVMAILMFAAVATGCSSSSSFPSSPITFIIGFDPGTGADTSGRLLASIAEDSLDTTINIVNSSGTSGAISYTEILTAENDGYTLVQGTATLLTHNLMGTIEHSFRDLTPIATFQSEPSAIYISSAAPFDDFESMVEYAAAHPGEVTVATSSPGGITHIMGVALGNVTGLEFNLITGTGGGADGVTQCAGGHVDMAVGAIVEGQSHVDAGNIIPMTVTAGERLEIWPEVPTMAELGIGDASVDQIRAVFGPADMDPEVVAILEEAFMAAAQDEDFLANVAATGAISTVLNAEETYELFEYYEGIMAPILEATS